MQPLSRALRATLSHKGRGEPTRASGDKPSARQAPAAARVERDQNQ
jgi:hypothetical protein